MAVYQLLFCLIDLLCLVVWHRPSRPKTLQIDINAVLMLEVH